MIELIKDDEKRTIGHRSWETSQLVARMREVPTNETITYDEIVPVIRRNPQGEGRSILETAREILMREDRIVFGVVRNIGLKRLNDVERVETGQDSIDHIRRTSKRAVRRVTCLDDYEALPNDMKIKHNTFAATFGALGYITGAKQMKQLESKLQRANAPLSLTGTLDAFRADQDGSKAGA